MAMRSARAPRAAALVHLLGVVAVVAAVVLALAVVPHASATDYLAPNADLYEGPASATTTNGAATFDVSAVLAATIAQYNIPGAVAAVISLPVDDAGRSAASAALSPAPLVPFEVHALGAAGVRRVNSAVKVDVDDAFHHGSNTKAMTALLIARKFEAGLLTYTTPIGAFFPYLVWSDTGVADQPQPSANAYLAKSPYFTAGQTTIHASWRTVTLGHLLSHASGIDPSSPQYGNDQGTMYNIEAPLIPLVYRINASDTTLFPVPSRQWFLTHTLGLPVSYQPPTASAPSPQGYVYSNYNYVLAGCILEELETRAWEHVLQAGLFDPLGMLSAGFGPPEIGPYDASTPPDAPWPHVWANGVWQPIGIGSPYNAIDNPEALGPALHGARVAGRLGAPGGVPPRRGRHLAGPRYQSGHVALHPPALHVP